jgi:hypothetical protein
VVSVFSSILDGATVKPGDLVKRTAWTNIEYGPVESKQTLGIVVSIDDSHRQTGVHVLFDTGIVGPIWEKHLEVVEERKNA